MDSTSDRPQDPEDRGDRPDPEAPSHPDAESAAQPAQGILRRSFLGISVFLGMLAVLVGRLFWVQVIDLTGRDQQAREKRRRTRVLPALRGEIQDANGTVMARSVQRYRIVVDQTQVADFPRLIGDESRETETITPQQLVYELADTLGLPDEEVRKSLDGDARYAVVAPEVTPDVERAVMELYAPFIQSEPLSKRTYPDGSIAGSVLGFLNSEGAAAGIELQFDEQLGGEDGEQVFEIAADGVRIPVGDSVFKPAVDGSTVKLTIDRDIQYFAQQQVTARARETNADWGTCVVMRIRDGAILALADSSTVDPNDIQKSEPEDWAVRAVSSTTEPGSTEKVLTASAVIEEGLSEPDTVFDVPAELTIDGELITDAFVHGPEKRTLAGIIADSMNTGTVLAGRQLSKDQRHDWLQRFGVGTPTGISLPGESQGILTPAEDWDNRQQYTVLFGQGVSQTPLQTAMAYQAIGNRGVRLHPRIVQEIVGPDGESQDPDADREGQRVVSEETARKMLEIMESVVTVGGAKEAAVEGWRVGGKTGTAEAPADDGSGFDGFTTSFVGMAPMEDPQYLVSVLLQRPEGDVRSIGTTVAFSRIMRKVLEHYRVPHSTSDPVELPKFAPGEDPED